MSRSVKDLRDLICISRFGFRPDEEESNEDKDNDTTKLSSSISSPNNDDFNSILFYFDPSTINNWLDITNVRLDKLRQWCNIKNNFIHFIHFWLNKFDHKHKISLFDMEFELFLEHLLLAFSPGNFDSSIIEHFARYILYDIDRISKSLNKDSDYEFIQRIEILSNLERTNEYRTILADLPTLNNSNKNKLYLQWMLAMRAFGLVSICSAAIDFYENIQHTLNENTLVSINQDLEKDKTQITSLDQLKHRVEAAMRLCYVDVIDYYFKTKQLNDKTFFDDNNGRNILVNAVTIGHLDIVEYLLKANIPELDINYVTQSGNTVLHVCVNVQRKDIIQLLLKYYPNINVNIKNKQQATPLHLAIIYGDVDIVNILLEAGADKSLLMTNKTCKDLAKDFNNEYLYEMFSH